MVIEMLLSCAVTDGGTHHRTAVLSHTVALTLFTACSDVKL